ncbi:MAG: cadherin-like beta sandwich domain-containing protein, partial [Bacteroidota bacterium]
MPTLFKFESGVGGAPNIEIGQDHTGSGWETLNFDFTSSASYNKIVFFIGFNQEVAGTFYIDDIIQQEAPPSNLPSLPVDFESTVLDYTFSDFGGNVSNTADDLDDNTNTVMEMVKNGGEVFAGTTMLLADPIDFGTNTIVQVRVRSPRDNAALTMKLEGAADSEIVLPVSTANVWETLNFNFVGQTAADFAKVTLIWDNGTAGAGGADWTFYLDDFAVVPTPAEDLLALPLDFESDVLNYAKATSEFGGSPALVIERPAGVADNGSVDILQLNKVAAATTFAGSAIQLGVPIDFGSNASIAMDVYAPRAGVDILLKLEVGAAFQERRATTTTSGEWETLFFDFLGGTNSDFVKVVLFWDPDNVGTGSDEIVYLDNITVAPTPEGQKVKLPLTFEDNLNYVFGDFNAGATARVENPQLNADNGSGFVMEMKKGASQNNDAGTTVSLHEPITFGSGTKIRARVYSPQDNAELTMLLQRASGGSSPSKVATTSLTNAWETLEFDFTGSIENDYNGITLLWEIGEAGDASADWTFLLDDIEVVDPTKDATLSDLQVNGATIDGFSPGILEYEVELPENTMSITSITPTTTQPGASATVNPTDLGTIAVPGGTATITVTASNAVDTEVYTLNFTVENPTTPPTAAAPAPTNDAANVASIFGDTYTPVATDVGGSVYANFGAANYEEVSVTGGTVLRYTKAEVDQGHFKGMDLGVANKITAATNGQTRMRFDAWFSKDLDPDSEFIFKVKNTGGTDTEGAFSVTSANDPEIVQGQWLTYDFALADLDPALGGTDDIQVFVIDVNSVREVYLDNIFLYNPVPVAPSAAPANPTIASTEVISIYSDAAGYDEPPGIIYGAYSDAVVDEIDLGGNTVLKYAQGTNDKFSIIELGGDNQIDLATTQMTNFRFDVWFSNDVAGDAFEMRPVNIGTPQTEAKIVINEDFRPAMKQGQWITYDFTLSELADFGMRGFANFQQIVMELSNVPEFYIDNIFFYSAPELPALVDANLADLKVNNNTVDGFSPFVYEYNVDVPFGNEPTLSATANQANAAPVINDVSGLPGTATVEVTANDGVTKNTYSVNLRSSIAPTIGPSEPIIAESKVLSIYSDAYTDVPALGFNFYGAAQQEFLTLGQGTQDETDVLRYSTGANNFQIIELGGENQLDLVEAGITNFTFDVWFSKSLDANSFFIVKIIDFGASTSTGFITLRPTSDPAIEQGSWLTYDFALEDIPGFGDINPSNVQQFVFEIQGVGEVYMDNIYFYAADPNPTMPVTFESTDIDYGLVGFGGPGNTPIPVDVVSDPDDNNNRALEVNKVAGSEVFAGVSIPLEEPIDFSVSTTIQMRVRSPLSAGTTVRLKIEDTDSPLDGNNNPTVFAELDIATADQGVWETIEFNFLSDDVVGGFNPSTEYERLVIFYDFGQNTNSSISYFDDIEIKPIDTQSDATLSDLQVDGVTVDGFSAGTTTYLVELAEGTTVVPTVTATATNTDLTPVVTPAAQLPGQTTVVVVSADESDTLTYTINFDVESDNLLANGHFEFGPEGWGDSNGNPADVRRENGNNFLFANTAKAQFAFQFNVDQKLDLTQDASYVLAFDAAADEGTSRTIEVGIGQNFPDFNSSIKEFTIPSPGPNGEFTSFAVVLPASFGAPNNRFFFNLAGDDGVIKIDNVSLTLAEPATFPLIFDDNQAYAFTEFFGAPTSVTTNPSVGGLNTSAQVGQTLKADGANGAGSFIDLAQPIDFSGGQVISMKLYSPKSAITVKLGLEGGAVNVEATAQNTVIDEWEVLEFDFSGQNPGADLTRMVFFFDDGQTGDGSTYFFDDVTFAVDNDATLSDLKVDDATIFGFSPETTDYTVELPFGTLPNAVPVVTVTANDIGANAVVNATSTVPGTTAVVVTAENTTTTETYNVVFTIADPARDASLSDLKLDDVLIDGFDSAKLDYQVVLPFGTAELPTVTATVTDTNASLSITQASTGTDSVATVLVTAQDVNVTRSYTVDFSIAPPAKDASLSAIEQDGNLIEGFDADVLDYDILLPTGSTVADIPAITATTTDPNANAVVDDVSAITTLPATVNIVVTAEDVNVQQTYTVNIALLGPDNDATLSGITVDGASLDGFNSNTFSYDYIVPFSSTVVPTVAGTPTIPEATVDIAAAATLADTTKITVTARDGNTQQVYRVAFPKDDPSNDVALIDLTVNGTTIAGFDSAKFTYALELPAGTTTVPTVVGVPADNNATVAITPPASLPGLARALVTAENDTITRTYAISLTVANPQNLLVNGTFEEGAPNAYDPWIASYGVPEIKTEDDGETFFLYNNSGGQP